MLAAQSRANQRNNMMHGHETTGDEFSDDGEDDLISSSLAETPAGEEDGTVTVSPLCTTGKQTSERHRRARVTQDGQQVQQDIRKVTAQLARDVQGIGAAGQRLAGHLQDSGPQLNFYRSTEDDQSSKLSETPKAGAQKRQEDGSESEELSPLAGSDI